MLGIIIASLILVILYFYIKKLSIKQLNQIHNYLNPIIAIPMRQYLFYYAYLLWGVCILLYIIKISLSVSLLILLISMCSPFIYFKRQRDSYFQKINKHLQISLTMILFYLELEVNYNYILDTIIDNISILDKNTAEELRLLQGKLNSNNDDTKVWQELKDRIDNLETRKTIDLIIQSNLQGKSYNLEIIQAIKTYNENYFFAKQKQLARLKIRLLMLSAIVSLPSVVIIILGPIFLQVKFINA